MAAVYERKNVILDFLTSHSLFPLPHLHKGLELIHIQRQNAVLISHLSWQGLFQNANFHRYSKAQVKP